MKQIDPKIRKITWALPAVKISECAALRLPVHAFCSMLAGHAHYTSVNALARGEKALTVRFPAHRDNKSDGFLLLDQGDKGLDVFLADGGLATGESLQALLSLRERILTENGLAAQVKSPRYKLEITLLISHFHIDHVNALIQQVLPCRKFIRIKAAYYPQISAYAKDKNHLLAHDGDVSHRANFLRVAACYQPLMEKREIPFAQTLCLPLQNGELQFFAQPKDWGEAEGVQFFKDHYHKNDPQKAFDSLSVAVVNANSLWMRAQAYGKSVLLTGDTTKKFAQYEEALDVMIARYGDMLRSDIVKMPHHGFKRNKAVPLVVQHLLRRSADECVVLTALEGNAHTGVPLREMNVPHACNKDGEITFTLSAHGIARL